MRANLTRVPSPPNPTTGGSPLILSIPFSHFFFIFHLPQCILPDFTAISSLASLPFLSCYHHNKHKYRRFPSYLLCTLLLFPSHLSPSPVHPTGFSFCFFTGFLAFFTLLSSNNNNSSCFVLQQHAALRCC